MKNLLMNCFYDNMTIAEAADFIIRCYGEEPTERQIKNAQKTIKSTLNVEWK